MALVTVLHPAQSQIAQDKHRFRVVCAGRRLGKTTLAVFDMLCKAIAENDRRVYYVSPTFQQSRDIAWQELKRAAQNTIVNVNETRLELEVRTQRGGTSSIWLRGWEAVETLRGQHADLIVVDEVASMRNFWTGWHEVLRPMLADTKGEVLFISTPKGFNHFYDLFNKEKEDKDFKSFRFTTYDNPFIPVEEIEKAKSELPADQFAQEFLADFRKRTGLVYPEFDRQTMVFTTGTGPKTRTLKLAGIDWGYTNPCAVLEIVRDADNHFWVLSEWYKPGQTTDQIIEWARSLRAEHYYPDPAEPDRVDALQRAGCPVRDVSKDVIAGIDSVRMLFRQRRLHIHSSCVNLINELETYSYKEKRPNSNEPEEPIKENDHALDALRYVIHMQSPSLTNLPNKTVVVRHGY